MLWINGFLKRSVLILGFVLLSGCSLFDTAELEGACPVDPQPAISLRINSLTGNDLQGELFIILQDDSYVDSATLDLSGFREVGLAIERPGVYQLIIMRAGEKVWEQTGITVQKGPCHVETVEVEAVI